MDRKAPLISLWLALLGLVILSACTTASDADAVNSEPSEPQPRTITVTGQGVAYGAPDILTLQIGISGIDSQDPLKAIDQNLSQMAMIRAALTELSVDEKDIQSTSLSLSTGTDSQWYAVNSLLVTVRDLSRAGEVLSKVRSVTGGSYINVTFAVSDPIKLENEARTQAMAEAQARAEGLAAAAGVTVDKVLVVNESLISPAPNVTVEVTVTYSIK